MIFAIIFLLNKLMYSNVYAHVCAQFSGNENRNKLCSLWCFLRQGEESKKKASELRLIELSKILMACLERNRDQFFLSPFLNTTLNRTLKSILALTQIKLRDMIDYSLKSNRSISIFLCSLLSSTQLRVRGFNEQRKEK